MARQPPRRPIPLPSPYPPITYTTVPDFLGNTSSFTNTMTMTISPHLPNPAIPCPPGTICSICYPNGDPMTQDRRERRTPPPRKKADSPLAGLTDDQKKFLTDQVLTTHLGDDESKRKFIREIGLPAPPYFANITVTIKVPVPPTKVRSQYGQRSVTQATAETLRDDVTKKIVLPDGWALDVQRYAGQTIPIT